MFPEPPEVRVGGLLLNEVLRLDAEADAERVTVPLKPFQAGNREGQGRCGGLREAERRGAW